MKRKELMKRALALALSAVMTVGNMPAVTYASETVQTEDGGASQDEEIIQEEEFSQDEELFQDEELIQDEAEEVEEVTDDEDLTAQDVAEDEAQGDQDIVLEQQDDEAEAQVIESDDAELAGSVGVQTTDEGFQVLTADEEADATDDAKTAATDYLKKNYIDDNKIITNGGTGVEKSADGLSYSVGLKMPSGSSISSIRLKTESSSSSYKSGWYINTDWLNIGTKKPSNLGSLGINRPTADQGAQTFTATLRLFSSDITTDVINDEAQAATAALATQEFNITIEAAEPNYTLTVKVQDEDGTAIDDATVTLEKNWNTVSPKEDGSYDMEKGAEYTLTVKKDGYLDYKESYFTFNPTEINTVKTVTLKKIVNRNIKFNVTDKATGKTIDGAKVTVKKGYYDTVKPEEDGSYNLVSGTTYNYTVEATNYKTISSQEFTPEADATIDVQLEKNISKYTVSIKPVDSDNNVVENASIKVTYEEEDDYYDDTTTIDLKANNDGTYTMEKGVTYTYTVTAPDYKEVTGTYTPSGTEEVIELPVTMQKEAVEVTECKVTIQAVDSVTKEAIANAAIKVTYEDYDTYYENPYTAELSANEDGTYTMKKDVEYTCTATADGYEAGTAAYTPDGKDAAATVLVSMVKKPVATEDQNTVDAIKAAFDKELGALRPNFAKEKNILDLVRSKIAGYEIDTTGVTVSVKSTDDPATVAADGTINYWKQAPNTSGVNSTNVALVFVFEKNGAKADTEERNATICWDRDYFNTQMATDQENLTWDKIKGSNTDAAEVTSNLTLPQCLSTSAKTAWSQITWTSSNESVISFKDTGYGSLIDAKEGVINPQPEDTEVTLTATFNANDNLLNSYVEKVADFATLTKEFKVTVKGTGSSKPTEAELKAILDQYYTADQLKDFTTGAQLDTSACTGDIQLPRYTRIKDGNGEYVFANKEIVVTSSNTDVMTVNGYRAAVDRFATNEDVTANLIVTFTREGVTAVKEIPVTIKPITEAEVQDELKMMEAAKEHYFDGLNDGQYADKDSITGNLHPFQEMIFDENDNVKWIYNNEDKTGKGIIADDMFEDSWEMEGAGYNKFKSSNNAIVAHENLVVVRPESDTQITISSILSSERYGEAAKAHPDNIVLQKLYKQPVSVTVTIKGTKAAEENLKTQVKELQDLLDSITEGSEPGQYPAGTKDKLQAAMKEAETLLGTEGTTEEAFQAKVNEITSLLKDVQDSQNEEVATVTAKINQIAGKDMDVSKMTVGAHTAETYHYTKPEAYKNKVTVLDVLVAWHAANYGQAFKFNPTDFLNVTNGFINKIYGEDTMSIGLLVNNAMPGNATADTAVVKTGDTVTVFRYSKKYEEDLYLYFEGMPETVKAKENITLTLYGYRPGAYPDPDVPSVQKGYTVAALDAEGNRVATAVTDENGVVVLQINTAGTYKITVVETPAEAAYVFPADEITVTAAAEEPSKPGTPEEPSKPGTPEEPSKPSTPSTPSTPSKPSTPSTPSTPSKPTTPSTPAKHTHSYGKWRTVSAATVFSAKKQERVCACGKKQTRKTGKALKPVLKVNMTTVLLKTNQTTSKLKVSGLAKGDSVVSYKTSNKKIFTVDKKGKIKAGKKTGTAKLTITLKSGLKKTIKVKVQKAAVKTQKIQGLKKTLTLKKGKKATLKPVLQPLTSTQKISYTSSNKKVATVSSKGVVTAKKAGKVTITVKSGSKKFKITVNVK